MGLDIDGFAVLRSIAARHSLFQEVAVDAAKAARTLVTKKIKNKFTNLKTLRDVHKTLGSENFKLIVDGIPDTQIKTLLNRLDKYHPELKASTSLWRRQQLSALVDGSAEPTAKPVAPSKRKRAASPREKKVSAPKVLHYSSAGATRKR